MSRLSNLLTSLVSAVFVTACSTPQERAADDIDDGYKSVGVETLDDGTKIRTLRNGCIVTETRTPSGYTGIMKCPDDSEPN